MRVIYGKPIDGDIKPHNNGIDSLRCRTTGAFTIGPDLISGHAQLVDDAGGVEVSF